MAKKVVRTTEEKTVVDRGQPVRTEEEREVVQEVRLLILIFVSLIH